MSSQLVSQITNCSHRWLKSFVFDDYYSLHWKITRRLAYAEPYALREAPQEALEHQLGTVPHSSHEGHRTRQEESGRLLRRLDGRPYVILLDESGANITSPSFSELFTARLDYGTQVTIVIGGAYGVDETIHRRADAVISLSKLVFPHQLVRLIITEQIYRAQQIAQGSGYHHS